MFRSFMTSAVCLFVSLAGGAALAQARDTVVEDAVLEDAEVQRPTRVEHDPEAEKWQSLISEDGLEGWTAKSMDQFWTKDDGMIVGENPRKRGSILWTENEYTDYELIVQYQTPSADYDSGVFLRGPSHQAQIGVSRSLKKDLTGCLYCPKDGNGKYPQQPHRRVKATHKLGEWNTMHITVKGKHIVTKLNGVMINDYQAVKIPQKGKVGLQLHANVHMKMEFRVVKIRELDS